MNLYQVGHIYIWQNLRSEWVYLNGSECTVIAPHQPFNIGNGIIKWGTPTDTVDRFGIQLCAQAGELRPKLPPPGEQSIMELFNQPEFA